MMNTRLTWLSTLACAVLLAAACGGGNKAKNDGGNNNGNIDAGKDGVIADASNPCSTYGMGCTAGAQCCSGTCDSKGQCAANPTTCSKAGSSCSAGTDCCSGRCVSNVCLAKQCVADNNTCSQNGDCCSGLCQNKKCTPLNTTCKTNGNPCKGNADCCSGKCNSSKHCGQSSFCTQNGDACAHDAECCGGICTKAKGALLGTCTQPNPGSTYCSNGIDGTLCNGCGDCCSRLCAVYKPTGVKICQPAQGCVVDGDLCRKDSDCCGAAGSTLPGAGNVQCVKENSTDPVGVCRNPMSCNPEGDVCHYKNYTCSISSAQDDCCACISTKDCCKLDSSGIPRCSFEGNKCVATGGACSYSGDCCKGVCAPNSNGKLVCQDTCVPKGGACTNSADCCTGLPCVFTPGQTYGVCGGGSSGGGPDAGANAPDAAPAPDAGTCSLYGQPCSTTQPCCNGVQCTTLGSATGATCTSTDPTKCSCYTVVQ